MLFDLTGKTAVITGSSRGIGRSIAEEMAKLGAKVVVSSRKQPACEEVAEAIRADGGEAIAHPCNIGHKDQLESLVEASKSAFGKIDILVCNAASNPVFGPMRDLDDEAWDKVMNNTVKSAFWLANMVLPDMAERRDGAVIMISSIAAYFGNRKLGMYAISKAAEIQLVRNLAVEWGEHNIRVNAIAPGLVKTDFARALWEDPARREVVEKVTPLQRIGDPVDIAGLACCLAGDAGRFITGQSIIADGGRLTADPA